MSPSTRRIWLALLVIAFSVIVMRSLVRDNGPVPEEAPGAAEITGQAPGEIPVRHVPRQRKRRGAEPEGARAERTTGVFELPTAPPADAPALSGYVVDLFDQWTTIPAGYVADGVMLQGGRVTLAGDPDSTSPRTGVLVSPPLPLHLPAMAAPVDDGAEIPPGAEVQVQIRLSEDGESWSPWMTVERYRPPDGNRIAPSMQPMLAKADLAGSDSFTSSSDVVQIQSGPAIRYRLSLSATGKGPSVSDIRIWKRESR